MNKLRLVLNDEVVGWQESRFAKEWGEGLFIYQSIDGREWSLLSFGGPPHNIPHGHLDRSTGETDSKGVGIFENDEVLCSDGEHGIVRWKDSGWYMRRKNKAHSSGSTTFSFINLAYCSKTLEVIGRANDSP